MLCAFRSTICSHDAAPPRLVWESSSLPCPARQERTDGLHNFLCWSELITQILKSPGGVIRRYYVIRAHVGPLSPSQSMKLGNYTRMVA